MTGHRELTGAQCAYACVGIGFLAVTAIGIDKGVEPRSYMVGLAYGGVVGFIVSCAVFVLLFNGGDAVRDVVSWAQRRRQGRGNLQPSFPQPASVSRRASGETLPQVPQLGGPCAEGSDLRLIRQAHERRRTGEVEAVA